MMSTVLLRRADEPRMPFGLQWENCQEVRCVEADMQLAVHRRATCLPVRNIEEVVIRTAWEADPQSLAHDGVRAIAPGNEGRCARFGTSVRAPKAHKHPRDYILKVQQFRAALDRHTGRT